MTAQTPVAVGSTTKPLTATAVMQLVEAGKVELDAPVTRYLPWFNLDDPRSAQITVRQLLSHTSGIPASAALIGGQEPDALERRVRALEWEKLRSAPGARWEYANDGYNTLGLIVQTVSGMPYEQYVAEKILNPLKMSRSTFEPARAAELGLAQGYVKRKGELRAEKTRLTKAYNPAGMLLTSADDAGRFLAALANGGTLDGVRVLSQESLDRMLTPVARVGDNLEYGLGWFLSQQEGLRAAVHPGEVLTMGSMFVLVPERRLGVAVLANLDNDGKDEIAEGVARLLIGMEPVLREVPRIGPENTFVPNRAVWDRYVGEYETPQGALRISREGDKLVGGIMSFGFELEPISDTKFVIHTEISSFDETVIELRPEADGSVSLYVKGQRFGIKR
jgi:CubicO group peptidase (beta-lactamase class C family)